MNKIQRNLEENHNTYLNKEISDKGRSSVEKFHAEGSRDRELGKVLEQEGEEAERESSRVCGCREGRVDMIKCACSVCVYIYKSTH